MGVCCLSSYRPRRNILLRGDIAQENRVMFLCLWYFSYNSEGVMTKKQVADLEYSKSLIVWQLRLVLRPFWVHIEMLEFGFLFVKKLWKFIRHILLVFVLNWQLLRLCLLPPSFTLSFSSAHVWHRPVVLFFLPPKHSYILSFFCQHCVCVLQDERSSYSLFLYCKGICVFVCSFLRCVCVSQIQHWMSSFISMK